ncbi:MAG TPA: cell wall-active antibiotics response protein LiaF [Bacillales bacterium]|nr:cell wall-active antibiotics response protein LiaF [Bacillales bacterium]
MRRLSATQFLLAICFVGFGILLLLVNTGIISVEITEAIVFCYPFLLVLLGLFWCSKALFSKWRRGSLFWGIIFIVFGGLLIADRFDVMTFTLDMVWKLWPLLLIYIGFKILAGRKVHMNVDLGDFDGDRAARKKAMKERMKSQKQSWRLVSDAKYTGENWSVEPMDRSTGVADYKFDFTKTFIPEKETPIKLSGWVGDIKIKVPEDVAFSVMATASVGDIRVDDMKEEGLLKDFYYATEGYEEAERKLVFDFHFKVLDLRIDRV